MNKRIVKVRNDTNGGKGMSQEAFALKLGTSRNAIANYELGRVVPDGTFIQLLCVKFHVREEWLRTGEGEMYAEGKPDDVAAFCEAKGLTGLQAEVLKAYVELPPDLRMATLNYFQQYFDRKRAAQAPPGEDGGQKDGQ